MRVLVALQYYLPHRTGLTLHVQRLAEALAARGHSVTVLTARFDPAATPRDEEVVNGVRVVRLWAPLRVSRGMVMPAYPWAALALVRQHDVVSLHTPAAETAIFGLYTRWLRRGLVITHHGDLVLPRGRLNRMVETVTLAMFRFAAGRARHLIAYSDDYAAHSRYLAGLTDRTTAVAPPIAIPAPDPARAAALRRRWLGDSPPGALLVGYAGRFVEEKRPDVLIRALPAVQRAAPGSKLVFAGQYRLRYERFFERHRALIERHGADLVFLDLIEDADELAAFYAACDVLALPSDSECFALVQVEAMCCGTPVVATGIPGARVVVRRTGMGELVPPGDPSALADALLQVARDREHYVRPRRQIEELFDLGRTIDEYERLLADAARPGPA